MSPEFNRIRNRYNQSDMKPRSSSPAQFPSNHPVIYEKIYYYFS